jgi:chaperone modulatory protein CbpM
MTERRENAPVVEIIDEEMTFTVRDLCRCSGVETTFVETLVAEGILEPETGDDRGEPRFPAVSLKRTQVTLRLTRDLGVNLAGAALALELLDRIESLQARLRIRSTAD